MASPPGKDGPNGWYLRIEGELMADSTLNRVATGARYIDLDGPNMRSTSPPGEASSDTSPPIIGTVGADRWCHRG